MDTRRREREERERNGESLCEVIGRGSDGGGGGAGKGQVKAPARQARRRGHWTDLPKVVQVPRLSRHMTVELCPGGLQLPQRNSPPFSFLNH